MHIWNNKAHFLSLSESKLRLCSANHRAGYFSNLPCDWPSTAWAYLKQETENGPRTLVQKKISSYKYRKLDCYPIVEMRWHFDRQSFLHSETSYTHKMTSLFWIQRQHFYMNPGVQIDRDIRAHFLSLARSKLRLCLANHRAGYFSNLACDWLSTVWAYSKQETENRPRSLPSWMDLLAYDLPI